MRVMLFFDLPSVTKEELKCYRHFIKNLKKNGFYMLQESVYVKMAIDSQVTTSTINKVKSFLPPKGNIIVLSLTEKQFSNMEILLGENQTNVETSDERFLVL